MNERRLDIQGLRALAVVVVLAFHAAPALVPGGFIGVDVFFVISGFLITGHLLRGDRIRFGEFYARRIRRILPAAVLVIIVTVAVAWMLLPPLLMRDVARDAIASALYVPNLLFAVEGTDYWASSLPSLFTHYWSLGVEEQFYLVWPLLLLIGIRWRRMLPWVVGAVLVGSFAASIVVSQISQPWAFYGLPTRAWEFAAGGALAMLPAPALGPRVRAVFSWAGFLGLLAAAMLMSGDLLYPSWWAAIPVALAAAVILGDDRRGGARVVLAVRPVRYVGDISYSLYLWHWPVLVMIPLARGAALTMPETLLALAVTVVLSVASYHLVENPFRRARPLKRPRNSFGFALGSAAVASLLAVAAVVVPVPQTSPATAETPLASSSASPTPEKVPLPPSLTPSLEDAAFDRPRVYTDGCHLDAPAIEGAECIYGDGDGPRVVLFGDSHAAQWFDAIETSVLAEGGRLLSLTKSACPPETVTVPNEVLGREYRECDVWREHALTRIDQFDPELVLMGSDTALYEVLAGADALSRWRAAAEATIDAIDAPVIYLSNSPLWPEEVPVCLARHPDDVNACSAPLAAIHDPALDELTGGAAAALVETAELWCPTGECGTIDGDVLMYRDTNHVTSTWVRSQTAALWALVEGAIP